ncbi:hypothetical protein [Occallatibacter savannae]|uniref:hypothetical protein n=1 Tax=Occallatibacter savannae TaxID=1002691 RepID=UPI000D697DAF|nr:hypothetical protein [Occallatibacter savannae]
MERGKLPTKPDLALSPAVPVQDLVADELSRKMQTWSEAWFGAGSGETSAEQSRLRQRLLFWLKRLLGDDAGTMLSENTQDLSLAKSTPLLTAFLGRKAMVEVSRRVLNDE